jgi:hypothetical protein
MEGFFGFNPNAIGSAVLAALICIVVFELTTIVAITIGVGLVCTPNLIAFIISFIPKVFDAIGEGFDEW